MIKENILNEISQESLVEVFTTNIQCKVQAETTLKKLQTAFPESKINFDINETELPYPAGHTILRVENHTINAEDIIRIVNLSGFRCDILEDKKRCTDN